MATRFLSNEDLVREFEQTLKFTEIPEAATNLRDELLRRLSAHSPQDTHRQITRVCGHEKCPPDTCYGPYDVTYVDGERRSGRTQGSEPERSDGRICALDGKPFDDLIHTVAPGATVDGLRTHSPVERLTRAVLIQHRGPNCATAADRDEPTHLCTDPKAQRSAGRIKAGCACGRYAAEPFGEHHGLRLCQFYVK